MIEVCGQEAKNSDFKPRSTVAERQKKQHRAFGGNTGEIKYKEISPSVPIGESWDYLGWVT